MGESVCELFGVEILYTGLAQRIDAYTARRMDDLITSLKNTGVDNAPLGILKENQSPILRSWNDLTALP